MDPSTCAAERRQSLYFVERQSPLSLLIDIGEVNLVKYYLYLPLTRMKYDSPVNNVHSGIIVEYHRTKTGPNFFMVFYKNLSTVCFTRKEVRNRLGTARFTETSKVLSEWVDEMIEKYEQVPTSPDGSSNEVLEYAKTAGFGPEAHEEGGLDENDPNYQTRTVI